MHDDSATPTADTSTHQDPAAGKVGETGSEKAGKQEAADRLDRQAGEPDPTGPIGEEANLSRAPKWQPRYPGSGRLSGKVALVTGGDSGIGRAIAALFAREGAEVAIVYLHHEEDAEATLDIIRAEGSDGLALQVDVADRDACHRCVDDVVARFGRLDILVCNAGVNVKKKALDVTAAEFDFSGVAAQAIAFDPPIAGVRRVRLEQPHEPGLACLRVRRRFGVGACDRQTPRCGLATNFVTGKFSRLAGRRVERERERWSGDDRNRKPRS